MSSSSMTSSWAKTQLVVAYFLFGALHEVAHLWTARILLGNDTAINIDWIEVLLGRMCSIPSAETAQDWEISAIRNAGWFASVLLFVGTVAACQICQIFRCKHNKFYILRNPWVQASLATATEALASDLLGFSSWKKTTFLCGNFGVILLNQKAWTSTPDDYGKTALDLLEKMIEITMMRGAQTGGVLAWSGNDGANPIRVRVVNGKRSDLSEKLRKALNHKICSNRNRIDPSIRVLLGHTRFATSSKSTLDGTHPHIWSPPEIRRVYPFHDFKTIRSNSPTPAMVTVSNYVTHNGDFDFFKVNGVHADLEAIQSWLEKVTGHPMPAPVDSAAIAGMIDIIRCGGCWALSIRFALLIASKSATVSIFASYPSFSDYARFGEFFEATLPQFCKAKDANLQKMQRDPKLREIFVHFMLSKIHSDFNLKGTAFRKYAAVGNDIEQAAFNNGDSKHSLVELVTLTIDAFLDNDLFYTTKFFMKNAVGSFGVMVTSSIDAKRQICIAARGQPMSIAFFPGKSMICYGSELAAVKAGMMFDNPAGNRSLDMSHLTTSTFKLSDDEITQETCRYDLDDLGGETVLVDYGSGKDPKIRTSQESLASLNNLRDRITPLKRNGLLIPLTPDADDQILDDIQSIPAVLDRIQCNWREGGLNRMTAWNLGRQLKRRLQNKIDGKDDGSIDIVVTGCEVSLYVAEQFASDLQKSFPKLSVQSMSSNKILGVFGQELSVPAIGFPITARIPDLKNSIVIIVSHSGGTFAPLAISNLLQSVTRNIFTVSSEWDTQAAKQLRGLYKIDQDILSSRIFTTDIGVRPSEPCSLSVAATHQLLTQIFEHLCLIILNEHKFRVITGAVITEQDLKVLERCNMEAILALERIVGFTTNGEPHDTTVHQELREAGQLWADHVLENVRAYVLSFIYIVVTVTIGYPIVTGISVAVGMTAEWAFYITRFLDSLIYFFLPQINVILVRLIQKRNLLHRMTGRTVVVGDIPWVAQSAEAFLSKIFARSYSIAGLNVHSGNPSDHLVHRHTHRIVRGTLLVCGRPDGRLEGLTSAECSVNLAVNQASSIQSIGGTCESITIGHNPSRLHLTKTDITLGTYRPKFLCEVILDDLDSETKRKQHALAAKVNRHSESFSVIEKENIFQRWFRGKDGEDFERESVDLNASRSSSSLKGAYLGLRQRSARSVERSSSQRSLGNSSMGNSSAADLGGTPKMIDNPVSGEALTSTDDNESDRSGRWRKNDKILAALIHEKSKTSVLRKIFNRFDSNGKGTIDLNEFTAAYQEINPGLSDDAIAQLFKEGEFSLWFVPANVDAVILLIMGRPDTRFVSFHRTPSSLADIDGNGDLDYSEFEGSMLLNDSEIIRKLQHAAHRDTKGLLQVLPSSEEYFGSELYTSSKPGISAFAQAHGQHFSMELYESRIASLERFTALCVMFHQMGKTVQDFFPRYSCGLLGYKMNRTHSIMRIATTASPVSGDAVRDQMEHLRIKSTFENAVHKIGSFWHENQQKLLRDLKDLHMSTRSIGAHSLSSHRNRTGLDDSISSRQSLMLSETGEFVATPIVNDQVNGDNDDGDEDLKLKSM
ncbi:MAG: hypothetical protein SGILL_001978 [Bacillariaceae sp.]